MIGAMKSTVEVSYDWILFQYSLLVDISFFLLSLIIDRTWGRADTLKLSIETPIEIEYFNW